MNEKKYIKIEMDDQKKRDVHRHTHTHTTTGEKMMPTIPEKKKKDDNPCEKKIVHPKKRWPLKNDDQPSHTKK